MFEVLAPIIGSVAGGLLGGSSDTEATTTSSPWSGIQPYLIGDDPIPSYLTSQPQVSDVYNSWADRLRTGAPNSWMEAPPPMWNGMDGEASWDPWANFQNFNAPTEETSQGEYFIPTNGFGGVDFGAGYWSDTPETRQQKWYRTQSG